MSRDDNFLARWSQRKREAAKPAAQDAAPLPQGDESQAAVPATAEEEPFDLELLPKIGELTPDTDITPFMHKAVPEALRNAALRKMWALDPAIRDYVGEALDYAWDWNTPGGVPGSGGALSETALEFARSLFSDPPAQENVIETVKSQDPVSPEPQPLQSNGKAPVPEDGETSSTVEKPSQIAAAAPAQTKAQAAPEDVSAPQAPRRHGGAMPRL